MSAVQVRVVGTFKEYADFYQEDNAAPYKDLIEMVVRNCDILNDDAHILDIGCGGAFTIDLLQDKFKEVSLIEPNQYFRAKWFNKSWINDNKHVLHLYPLTIEEVIKKNILKPNSIDAIIIFHPIYHFELESLKETLNAITTSLKPTGVCVISVIDDADPFCKLYPKLSPKYALNTKIEQILNGFDTINYTKEYGTDQYVMTYSEHLKFAEWLFVQDCMNQNYFPDGMTKKQLDDVRVECKKFIKKYSVKKKVEYEPNMYEISYGSIHFVIKKENQFSKL